MVHPERNITTYDKVNEIIAHIFFKNSSNQLVLCERKIFSCYVSITLFDTYKSVAKKNIEGAHLLYQNKSIGIIL